MILIRLLATRIAIAILTLLFVSVAVFVGTGILAGDVAEAVLGQSATPEAVAGLRQALHLDQPPYTVISYGSTGCSGVIPVARS